MKYHKTTSMIFSFALLVTVAGLASSAPVFAQHGAGETETTTSSTSSEPSHVESSVSTTMEQHATETETKSVRPEIKKSAEVEKHAESTDSGLHAKGAALLAEARKEHKSEQTAEQLKKRCEARKHGMTVRFSEPVRRSQATQTRIDGIFTKAKAYQTTSGVTPDNYDSLVAAAEDARVTSSSAVASLQGSVPSVDCGSTTLASDIATYKVAVEQTRDSLKAYRSSVKAVLQALKTANAPATTGGTQ